MLRENHSQIIGFSQKKACEQSSSEVKKYSNVQLVCKNTHRYDLYPNMLEGDGQRDCPY